MNWSAQVFRYCERGSDPSFWAEPLNAVSNAAFLIAAIVAAVVLARAEPKGDHRAAWNEWALIALVFIIGIGSFLFHTFATGWSSLADVIPIGAFMLAYLAYALRRYFYAGWILTLAGIGIFVGAMYYAGSIECRAGVFNMTAATRGPCLNGSLGYLPALVAMVGLGAALAMKRHPAGSYLLAAGGVFLMSMTFRVIDLEVCHRTLLGGSPLGTHFLWHILNATTLYLLLLAAIRTGLKRRIALERPDAP